MFRSVVLSKIDLWILMLPWGIVVATNFATISTNLIGINLTLGYYLCSKKMNSLQSSDERMLWTMIGFPGY